LKDGMMISNTTIASQADISLSEKNNLFMYFCKDACL